MLHLVYECQPLQTQHFFIFLFASFGMWLLIRLFANLRYSYSINSSLVHSFWYFWLAILTFKCQLASSARRAARSALPSAGTTVYQHQEQQLIILARWEFENQAYKAAKFITLPDRPADLAAKSLRHLSAKAGGEYWPSLEKITKILNEMSFFSKFKGRMASAIKMAWNQHEETFLVVYDMWGSIHH